MATYYWVGGTGTWSGTSNTQFAITSGGAATLLNPNATDTVIFDANSGTTATITVTSTAVSLNTTIDKADINLSLSGSPTLCTSAGTITFTAGTITLNTFTLTCGFFSSSNTNTRSILFGTGNITCTGNSSFVISMATMTGFTYTGTPVWNCTYAGASGTRSIRLGGTAGATEANSMSVNVSAGTDIISISGSVKNLIYTGFSGTLSNAAINLYGNVTYSLGMTITAGSGILSFLATSGTQQITTNGKTLDFPLTQNGIGGTVQLQDNLTMGSTRTYTLTNGTLSLVDKTLSTGFFSSNNSNIRTIAFGTGKIIITGNNTTVWFCGIIPNLTITGTSNVDLSYAGSTGTRNISHGQSSGGNEARAVNFNITAGTDTVAITGFGNVRSVNFSGFSGTWSNTPSFIYGNLTLSSGMTVASGVEVTTFAGTSGTQQITTAAKTLDFPLTFDGIGGTFAFQDALTQGSTRAFTITNGTVQLKNGVTSTVGSFVANNSSVKFLQSTTPGSQATLSQAAGTVNVVDLTIRDINAVGGASWNAYTDFENTDAGNNDGWNFSLSPPYSIAELPVTLRPFTQPRRF